MKRDQVEISEMKTTGLAEWGNKDMVSTVD